MIMKIQGTGFQPSIKLSPDLEKLVQTQKSDKPGFGEMLEKKIQEVDQLQQASDQSMTDFATGKSRNLHETILAMEMADTSLRMVVTVRNKALEAYNEIMKMPV